jgi:Zn-dependent membrane protease YugP
VGLILFAFTVVFQLINLPCEFDASKRARKQLVGLHMVNQQENRVVGKVLNAAAMTYVAALITSVLQLVYFAMLVAGGSRD